MSEQSIYEIIAKKLAGESSTKEDDALAAWLESDIENTRIFQALRQAWEGDKSNDAIYKVINQDHQRERVWNGSFGKNQKTVKGRTVPLVLFKIAASILIFVAAGWISWKLIDIPKKPAQISKTIIKENPNGQKSKIFLPDGSTVWLNAASKLSFHDGFSDSLRLVSLDGEAYFNVSKDLNRPFIVKIQGVRVVVLGTSFNVNTRHNGLLDVSLVKGKVRVSSASSGDEIILSPGEYSTFDRTGKFYEKGHFDQELTTSWKDGILYFKNASLNDMTSKLERWYGVKIVDGIKNPVSKHFTGRFDNENLDNVLRNISFALGFEYEINGNNIIIHNTNK